MGIVVLSLFDGMACGLQALKDAGIEVDAYYASEIDKHAMIVAKRNHPEIIHIGDVTDWPWWRIPHVDLVIGGSPCQGFSFAGKGLAFDDPRSKLFFTMIDIIDEWKPKNYMLENVRMKKEYLDVITDYMTVDPIQINSALVSAQNRVRYYWCSWDVSQPEDRGIFLKDVVHEYSDLVEGEPMSQGWCDWFKVKADYQLSKKYSALDPERAITLTARQYASWKGNLIFEALEEYIVPFDKTLKILDKEVARGKVGYFRQDSQANRVYYIHGKSVTLGSGGGGVSKMGQYLFGCITPDRLNKNQNGQRFNDGQKFYTLTVQDRHGVLVEGYIRKLTPIECERLQTLPDGYTEGVSNTQRYKMLGNGWTKNVIQGLFEQGEF